MPDNTAITKMIEGFLQSGLSARDAARVLAEAEKQATQLRRQRELQQFQAGLGLRNFLAFVFFVVLFLAIANGFS
jgi:multidrug efflux pump subunit AcrA (membrane-fusion protein)